MDALTQRAHHLPAAPSPTDARSSLAPGLLPGRCRGEVGGKEAQLPIVVVEELLKIDVACLLLLSHDFL